MTVLSPEDCAVFEAILGPDGVVLDRADMGAYAVAARYGAGRPAAVLRPRETSEVSRLVAHCVARGLRFIPQSGNTGLVLGSTPDNSGREVVISLERMTGALEVDPLDRTARVAAGVRLSALNAALEPHGLFLPIDLGADPMIGGMAATNTGGARFLRYGDMRRHVLGLEVVLPNAQGEVLRLSGGLRKDNSTLPLRQMFVGSYGLLGVITEVTLEVHPRPAETAAALLIPRPHAVLELLVALEAEAGETLTAFEGMSRGAMDKAFAHVPGLRNPFPNGEVPDYAVLVELTRSAPARDGQPSLDTHLESLLAGIAARDDTPLADALLGPADHLWALRHALSEGLRAAGAVVGFDLAFRRSAVFAFRAAACEQLASRFPDYQVCDFGHVADGGLHFNLLRAGGDAEAPARRAELRATVLTLAIEGFGGSFSGEHGLGRANQDTYERFVPGPVRRYSARLAGVFAEGSVGAFRLSTEP
jgi:FAD/FMN-containing dehydrogenase